MAEEPEFLSVQQAADRLGVNRRKIWKLIEDGDLEWRANPMDKRSRLVRTSKVDELKQYQRAPKRRKRDSADDSE